MNDITFVTGNDYKYHEALAIIPFLKRQAIDLPEIQSNSAEPIIEAKLHVAASVIEGGVVVEDVGLYCDALNGFPGPLVKWYLDALGPELLYQQVKAGGGTAAEARCVVGYRQDAKTNYFDGAIKGTLVEPRGEGFGWDSIFQPHGHNKTFGEMSAEEKIASSMRSLAFNALKHFLES